MERHSFVRDGLTLSYLDSGGRAPLIVALHALWMESGSYEGVAARLSPEWRVVSLDQRGHGHSDHAHDYSMNAFVGDVAALLDHLGAAEPVILMGNSMGAMVSFQFAARFPERVRALINEEGPAEEDPNLEFVLDWKGRYPTRQALLDKIGERLAWSVEPSLREVDGEWTLAFDPDDIVRISHEIAGNRWSQWLASDCPALVIRGKDSRAVDPAVMERMASERPNTRLAVLEGGHVVHQENEAAFMDAVLRFLAELIEGAE